MNNLAIGNIVTEGFRLGFKNLASVIGALVLWVLTIWIPYINVGTTIGLIGIIISMSKGKSFSATEIFNSHYRQYMGEFFLIVGFTYVGVSIGFLFMIIPGIVISLAWSLGIYVMLDREANPIEALKISNQLTHGHKWTIFIGMLLLQLILYAIVGLLFFIGEIFSEGLAIILTIIGVLVLYPTILGGYAHIYGVLSSQSE